MAQQLQLEPEPRSRVAAVVTVFPRPCAYSCSFSALRSRGQVALFLFPPPVRTSRPSSPISPSPCPDTPLVTPAGVAGLVGGDRCRGPL